MVKGYPTDLSTVVTVISYWYRAMWLRRRYWEEHGSYGLAWIRDYSYSLTNMLYRMIKKSTCT